MKRRDFSRSLGLLALGSGWAAPLGAVAARAATVRVDRRVKYQTIEGFGFFGARDSWWGEPKDLMDPAWARLVIDDLGLSLWRNEYYPPGDGVGREADADWLKQRPVVEALRDRAAASAVPLKTILSVWSPPSSMKCASNGDSIHEGTPNPGGTKDGGAVCPSQRQRFAEWLIDGLQLYALTGVKVYALSFQNEPLFRQSYNSGRYPRAAYADTLAAIGPVIHARFPGVKLFGPESLLDTEAGKNGTEFDPYWFTAHVLSNSRALQQLGAFAVHAYTPSMLPTAASQAAQFWTNYQRAVAPSGLPTWMTETSGYVDAWEGGKNAKGEDRPGAFDLAQALFAALYYGKVSAWLWWQGSESNGMSESSLMQGTVVGKRYYACKHFYRFIRPGARMLRSTSDDPKLLAVAFAHEQLGNFVSVLINGATSEKRVKLVADGLPEELEAFVTSAGTRTGVEPTRVVRDAITLPPRSIMTVVSGRYVEGPSAPQPGPVGSRRRL
jgi:glucuronoarabinoxylan endo-1,4-beta-xylanase